MTLNKKHLNLRFGVIWRADSTSLTTSFRGLLLYLTMPS
jgi:hypothetical protein